jgi:glycosyltransferase involved in cell wall biosynthesis
VSLLTVICGAYNEAQYLPETVPSMLEQTFRDVAFVLIDNGSTDDTWRLLVALTQHDPRVRLVRYEVNDPSASRLNQLVATLDTPWLLTHGADDRMELGYLQAVVDAMKNEPGANCIFSPWQWIDHPDRGVKVFPPYDPATICDVHQIPNWRAVPVSFWNRVGGEDATIKRGSDWDWNVRASLTGELRPFQLDKPYVSLRVRTDRPSESELVHMPSLRRHVHRHTPERSAIGEYAPPC